MDMTNLILTAYCACKLCCGTNATGITASGTRPVQGRTVACNFLPLGTRITVGSSTNIYVVEDRMAKRFTNRVDIFFRRHGDARKFGKQTNNITTKQ